MDGQLHNRKEERTHNSTYTRVAVQYLNQALCTCHSLCLAYREELPIRQLRGAATHPQADTRLHHIDSRSNAPSHSQTDTDI